MQQKLKSYFFIILLCASNYPSFAEEEEKESWAYWGAKTALKTTAAVAVGAGAVAATPIVLGAAGFTATGVAAGSLAATLQATTGGVIASGGLFATLQSAGAAGVGIVSNAVIAVTGGVAGYKAVDIVTPESDRERPLITSKL